MYCSTSRITPGAGPGANDFLFVVGTYMGINSRGLMTMDPSNERSIKIMVFPM